MEEETTVEDFATVEQIVIDFGEICRFCLTETDNRMTIHDKWLTDDSDPSCQFTISQFVTEITSIKVDGSDGFPSLVCQNCFNIIKMCLDFREACRQSDFSLRDCYTKTLEEVKAKFLANEAGLANVNGGKSDKVISRIEDMPECKVVTNPSRMGQHDVLAHNNSVLPQNDTAPNANEKEASEHLKVKTRLKEKQILFKRDSLNILKAGTIKQKYQRINSVMDGLKEARTHLVEDVLRTKDVADHCTGKERQKFSCPRCQMSFATSGMLTYHFVNNHMKEEKTRRTHTCEVCKKEFHFTHQLVRHYRNMHKVPTSKLSPHSLVLKCKREPQKERGQIYQCLDSQPPQAFALRKNLLAHVSQHSNAEGDGSVHTNKKGATTPANKFYTCTRCRSDQRFTTKFSLNRHLMNIHKMDRSEINDEGGDEPRARVDPPGASAPRGERTTHPGLKLVKIYVCVDCSPPATFSDVAAFIDHKTGAHDKDLDDVSLKELTPVYVESVNVFQTVAHGNRSAFRVVCRSCDAPTEFHSASDFVRHMRIHHGDVPNEKWEVETKFLADPCPSPKGRDRIWKCTECPASYIRKHSLHYHLKDKHNKVLRVGSVKCPEPDCSCSFFTNRQVIQHGITAHGKYFANLHKVFKDKILQGSPETDLRVRNFECDICQKKYLGKTSLKRHITKSHLGRSREENAICPYCGKTFANNLNLKSHIDFVHEALFVSCPICKKSINLKTIGKHYKTHQSGGVHEAAPKNRYLCTQCGRVLKSKSGFDDHQKLHLNVRDQICDVCGSGFTTKKNLYIHKKAHDASQKKVFECDKCDKVFTGKHTLNRHLLTHSGQKNFVCEMCSKCFYTLQELNRHVRYHRKEYRFDCQMCDMRFLDRSRFRHHMMRHRNIRPHKCHFCDKVFIVRRKMNLHMAARHNVEVQNTKAVWKDPKTYIPLDDLL